MSTLAETLATHYGLTAVEITPVPGGYIHQVWRAGDHVVKVYRGAEWTPATIAPTLAIQTHAAAAGHPVPEVRRTLKGDWLAPSPEGWMAVSAFAPGAHLRAGEATETAAGQIGAALGRLHRTLAVLPAGPSAIPENGLIQERAESLLAAARGRATPHPSNGTARAGGLNEVDGPDETDNLAMAAAAFRLEAIGRAPIDPGAYAGEVFQVVHGDYYPGNLLFHPDGRVSAILDWDFAGPRWRGLEVARALVETALMPDGGLDRGRAIAFLQGYTAEQPLTLAERQHMFRLWYDYLLASLYPLPLRYQPGAVLPNGWQGLARRRHGMLMLLHAHMDSLTALAVTIIS
ncbi:MAG TPA: phosphotransferase [Symbiobacteriaceae bacterium]|jgi:Ser/Thr protein kinase RdoA (MazF antagonist)